MVEKNTKKLGTTSFRIGRGEYILNVKKHYGPLNKVYSSNITVESDGTVEVDLLDQNGDWRIFSLVDRLSNP